MPPNPSKWEEGAAAARLGVKVTECPYEPAEYDFVTWHNGWATKTHLMAQSAKLASEVRLKTEAKIKRVPLEEPKGRQGRFL